jgi:hypothetical protein
MNEVERMAWSDDDLVFHAPSVKKFSEDQERDDKGRFASGGSGGRDIPSYEQLSAMKTVTGPLGSQGGVWKQDGSGQKFLMKPLKDMKHGFNEIAAGAVYHIAGIKFPNTGIVKDEKGKAFLVSEKIDGLKELRGSEWKSNPELQAKAAEGFGVDALLSHWDVHGMSGDNTLVDKNGDPVRIESGGAMAFRAMGGTKDSFSPSGSWTELQSMRESNQGRAMYGKMTDAQAADSLERAAKIDLNAVQARWDQMGVPRNVSDPWKATLEARQAQIPAIVATLRKTDKLLSNALKRARLFLAANETGKVGAMSTITDVRIIAKQGDLYLLQRDGKLNDQAQVFDADSATFIGKDNIHTLIAKGNWEFTDKVPFYVKQGIAKAIANERVVEFASAKNAIKKARELLKYNSDQERESNGRFGSGGGDDGGGKFPKAGTVDNNGQDKVMHVGNDPKPFVFDRDSTAYKHLIADGKGGWKFDAKRQALHEAVVKKFTGGVPASTDPTVHMLGGGPAAGKSTATNDPALGIPRTIDSGGNEAVLVNPDACKAEIPEYQQGLANGDRSVAGTSHEESSYMAQMVVHAALDGGKDIVLDGTGNSRLASAMAKIDIGREAGYKVIGTYVTCPTQSAVDRAEARGQREGRYVNTDVIQSTHASVSAIFPDLAPNFDSVRLIDTTNSKPGDLATVIATGTRGEDMTIIDPAAYQTFLDKAKEGPLRDS